MERKELSNEFIQYNPEMIDMGLPSGLLWSKYNLGAVPDENYESWYGNYYSWGETESKGIFSPKTYKYCKNKHSMTKYNRTDKKTIIEPMDDPGTALYHALRLPSKDEFKELIKYTTRQYVIDYNGVDGLKGILFTSVINDNELFIPESGIYIDDIFNGDAGEAYLWTNEISKQGYDGAYICLVMSNNIFIDSAYRYNGLSVRFVKQK